jgi:hypothetical protein
VLWQWQEGLQVHSAQTASLPSEAMDDCLLIQTPFWARCRHFADFHQEFSRCEMKAKFEKLAMNRRR